MSRWLLSLLLVPLSLTLLHGGGLHAGGLHAGGAGKAPVPTKAAQDKALKLVLEVFQDDLVAAKEPAAKVKLAGELLQQGRDTRDDQALRYVLLQQARELAAEGGDANLAFSAIEEVGKSFAIDVLGAKAGVLAIAVEAAATKEAGKALLDLTLPMIADALENDNYLAAQALGKVAESAARKAKSPSLVLEAQKRLENIAAAEKGFAKQQGYIDRIQKSDADAEAHLELGKYYGLVKRHWDKAMPHLAKGSDEALKALAERDLTSPKDAVPQLAIGDGWWDLAGKEKDPAKLALQVRAAFWYEKAVTHLTGLNRTKAQKRLDTIADRLVGTTTPVVGVQYPVGELKKIDGHTDEVKAVAFSHDGRVVASGGLDNSVRVWDATSGKEEKRLDGHSKQVWALAFHPNNRHLFSVSWDATVRLWDFKTGNEFKRFTHPKDLNGIALAKDGNTFLTACDDENARLINTNTGEEIRKYSGHTNFCYAVAFSPDGKYVASGGVDRTIRIHELAGPYVRSCDPQSNSVYQIFFTSDSKYLLSSGDNVVHVWEVATGKEARRFEGHTGSIKAMAISHDGKRLVTGGEDRVIRLWDVSTGKTIHEFKGHTDTVTALAFAEDGRRIVSGAGNLDRSVRVWGLPR